MSENPNIERISELDFLETIYEFEDELAQNRLDHITYSSITAMQTDETLNPGDTAIINGAIYDTLEVTEVEDETDMTDPDVIYLYNGTYYQGDSGEEAIGFVSENGFIVVSDKNTFVTPEMFGAKGDGVTNDTAAVQVSLNSGIPVYLSPKKTYRLENDITIPEYGVLMSSTENDMTVPNILCAGSKINLSDRKINCKNLSIKSESNGIAFNWTGINIRDMNFSNIMLDGFDECYHAAQGVSSYMWRIIFDRVHTTNCTTFINYETTYNAFNMDFKDCYFNSILKLKGVHATFYNCNFGLNVFRAINLEQSYIIFVSCNLENDEQVETQSIEFNQTKVVFIGCLLYTYQQSNTHFFEQRNGSEIIFISCEVKTKTGNAGTWWKNTGEGFQKYGNIIAWATSKTILPEYTYSGYENSGLMYGSVPVFATKASINNSKLNIGQIVYAQDEGLCIYDGTNLVKYNAST